MWTSIRFIDLTRQHRSRKPWKRCTTFVRAGKALYLGASSMWAWQFSTMLHFARSRGWTPFVSMQNHYNLVYREEEREMIPLCRAEGIGLIPWSPLARGLLADRPGETTRARTDAYAKQIYGGMVESDEKVIAQVRTIANSRGVAPAQVALAWVMNKPGITAPIIGASKPQHLADAVAALNLKLSVEEMAALEAPYTPHPIAGHE
jgi:aryl-alcohol dehydrogenase-like predicted oxidoreductase